MKLLAVEDNNITDDLQVTLTITYYNQTATTRLDVDLIITDSEATNRPPTTEEENDACIRRRHDFILYISLNSIASRCLIFKSLWCRGTRLTRHGVLARAEDKIRISSSSLEKQFQPLENESEIEYPFPVINHKLCHYHVFGDPHDFMDSGSCDPICLVDEPSLRYFEANYQPKTDIDKNDYAHFLYNVTITPGPPTANGPSTPAVSAHGPHPVPAIGPLIFSKA
ncbi:hypothetical protein YC2023_018737 [Brassica napus]